MEAQRGSSGKGTWPLVALWLGGSLAVWALAVAVTGALLLMGQIRHVEDAFLVDVNAIERHVEQVLGANDHVLEALSAFIGSRAEYELTDLRHYVERLLSEQQQVRSAGLLLWSEQSSAVELVPLTGELTRPMPLAETAAVGMAIDYASNRGAAVAVGIGGRAVGDEAYLLLQPLQRAGTARAWLLLEIAVSHLLPAGNWLSPGMTMTFQLIGAAGAAETVWLRENVPPGASAASLLPALHVSGLIGGGAQALALDSYRRLDWSLVQPQVAAAFLLAAILGLLLALGYGYDRIHREQARRRAEQELYQLANYDSLTGLPNRNLFKQRLQQALTHAEERSLGVALCFVDLDGFKAVNDRAGHDAGDQLLRLVAQRLSAMVRAQDTVARLAGDEFVVILEGVTGRANAEGVIAQLRGCFADSFVVGGLQFDLTASIGLAVFPEDGRYPAQLLRRADARMYASKYSDWGSQAAPTWSPAQAEEPAASTAAGSS